MKYATGSLSVYLDRPSDGGSLTVGDVRTWLAEVAALGFPDDTVLDDCVLAIWRDGLPVDTIECGNHFPQRGADGQFIAGPTDAILMLHDCDATTGSHD